MKHILITGASSGIGEALAYQYAAPDVILSLCARNIDRLENVAKYCRSKQATVTIRQLDVTDKIGMKQWIEESDNQHPLDLVIANAGVGLTAQGYGSAQKTFDINIQGLINTIHPALQIMEARGSGQIALMASIAGYIGLPSAPAYSASKNFVRAYGEALRGKLSTKGIKVNVICPGFVVSRLTDQNKFKMPFLMKTDKAASIIAKGLQKNKGRIAFPWPMVLGIKILSALPYGLYEVISELLPDKKSGNSSEITS